MNVGPVVNIYVVEALRGSEAEVVVAWGGGLSETSDLGGNKACGLLNYKNGYLSFV